MGTRSEDIKGRHLKNDLKTGCGCEAADAVRPGTGQRKEADRRRQPLLKDWVGRTFGSLTVVAYDGKRGGKHYWRCQCRCGGETIVNQSNLQDGHTKSCGCLSNPARTRHFVEGTCIESIRSRKISASNRSGVRGVYRNRRTGRWAAQITFQGKTRYLGSFETLEEAAHARARAEQVFEEFLERYARTLAEQVFEEFLECHVSALTEEAVQQSCREAAGLSVAGRGQQRKAVAAALPLSAAGGGYGQEG